MFSQEIFKFGQYEFSSSTIDSLIQRLIQEKKVVRFIAASSFLKSEPETGLPLGSEDSILIADGKPLRKLLYFKYGKTFTSFRGADFVKNLFNHPEATKKFNHFFIISNIESAEKLMSKLENRIQIDSSKILVPPIMSNFVSEYDEWIKLFSDKNADVIWISLGSPKQDRIAEDLRKRYECNFIAIGAALDFFSGYKSEAPKFFQFLYLEWLFRLISEPSRLWRRYLFGNFVFLRMALRFLFQKKIS